MATTTDLPEIAEIRSELEFLSTPRTDELKSSLRVQCAKRALKLLKQLETKLAENDTNARGKLKEPYMLSTLR